MKILKGRWQEGGERAKAMMRRDFERHAIPKTPFAFLGL
ncbi:Hypothetical Protein RSKD131_0346 [Cereibacter sphaeroides KD131]|nr:Hypothetical Protein RSKD131_0346 [Cereibacter sphaeroides KD131]